MDNIILLFCNPVSITAILAALSVLFYLTKDERVINITPFVILGIGLILSALPLHIIASDSGKLGLAALPIMLSIPVSVIISLVYFFSNLRKTAKILGNSASNEKNPKKISSNITVIYGYFIINIIIFVRILYILIYGSLSESGGFIANILALPSIILMISILIILLGGLSKKLYNIPILYFLISFLYLVFKFFVHLDKKEFYTYVISDIFFLVISTILLLKYLGFFKEKKII